MGPGMPAPLSLVQGLDAAVGVLDLDHGPLVDEQPGEVDGFVEPAAAIAADRGSGRIRHPCA